MQELRKLNTAEKTAEEAVLKLNIYFELFSSALIRFLPIKRCDRLSLANKRERDRV